MKAGFGTNIIPLVNYIVATIPDGLTDLEKIRYIYIKFGQIFSYDYRMIADLSIAKTPVNYSAHSISRFQTCTQICEILKIVINGLCLGEARIVSRNLPHQRAGVEHVAVSVLMKDGSKFLLDLTMDLFYIQAGLKTQNFGYTTDEESTYDIISLAECAKMDKKMNLVLDEYTDTQIEEVEKYFRKKDFSSMSAKEILEYKINHIKERLLKNFFGFHEASLYVSYLFTVLLSHNLKDVTKYNMYFEDDGDLSALSIFAFEDYDIYYSFSDFGLQRISKDMISNLLKSGWKTNSKTLKKIVNSDSQEKTFPF